MSLWNTKSYNNIIYEIYANICMVLNEWVIEKVKKR